MIPLLSHYSLEEEGEEMAELADTAGMSSLDKEMLNRE